MENNQTQENFNSNSKKGLNAVKKTGKAVISTSKKLAKTAVKNSAKIATTITKIAAAVSSSVLAPVIAIIAIIVVLLAVISPSNFFSTEGDLETVRNETSAVIKDAYTYAKYESYKQVADYINEKYSCSAHANTYQGETCITLEDGSTTGCHMEYGINSNIQNDKYYMDESKNICDIEIIYTSSLESATDSINAYANSVNGTLGTIGYGVIEAESKSNLPERSEEENAQYASDYVGLSEEEREQKLLETKNTVDNNGNEYETQLNDNYVSTLRKRTTEIFFIESDTNLWEDNVDYQKDVIVGYEQKQVCDSWKVCVDERQQGEVTYCAKYEKSDKNVKGAICASYHQEDDYTKPIKKDVAKGTITIAMNYDMTFYKKEEIEQLIKSYAIENEISEQEANDVIQETLYAKYVSYLELYGLSDINGGIFAGIDPIFMETGEKGFDGDFEISSYQSPYKYGDTDCYRTCKSSTVLNHIRNKFGISADTVVQCVAFTNSWLKDAYGISVSGNGQNIVGNLVRDEGWTLLDEPAPGAVFSVSAYGATGCTYSAQTISTCNPYGHTGVILSVHGDTVVLAESNVGSEHIYRTKTVSKAALLTGVYYKGKIKFAINNQ